MSLLRRERTTHGSARAGAAAPERLELRWPLAIAAFALAVWLVLRIVLLLEVGPSEAGWSNVPRLLAKGLWFDAAVLGYLLVPFLLAEALRRRSRTSTTWRIVRAATLWIVVFAILFEAVAELVFWNEFTARFDFIALDYLIYTHEVIGNIRSSYPVGWILAGLGAIAAALCLAFHRFASLSTRPLSGMARLGYVAAAVALPVASYFAADADQMGRIGNAHADELSGNGLFTLAAAARRNELDFDRHYATLPQEKADAILAHLGVRRPPLSHVNAALVAPSGSTSTKAELKRASLTAAAIKPLTRLPRNVVLVSVESLSAEYLGVYGSDRELTPNLDRLARAGLRFDQVFATGTRTVRGLEALSLGTPPIPGQAIVRRPNSDHLSTVGEILEHHGHAPYFIYGGFGYFDNMNAFFRGNDYHVVDRTDFPKDTIPFANIWGVADEALFANALRVFDRAYAQKSPFFATIMTTSNHRPYTYPEGRIDIPSPGGRAGGVKYTDYAIGKFIDDARHKPWFDDTVFIIVADHCADVAGKTALPVAKYRIPLIIYAPKLVPPDVYEGVASQIDIAPTILDLLGVPGSERFFGQSLLRAAPDRAFISNYQDLGYYKHDILTVLRPKRGVEAFRIDPATFEAAPTAVDPALLDEAIAYYQTGSRAFRTGALKSPDY